MGGCAARCCRHLSFPGVSGLAWGGPSSRPQEPEYHSLVIPRSSQWVRESRCVHHRKAHSQIASGFHHHRGWARALVPVVRTAGDQAAGQATVRSPAGHHTSSVHVHGLRKHPPKWHVSLRPEARSSPQLCPNPGAGAAGPPQAGDGGVGLEKGLPAPVALTLGTPDAPQPQAPPAEPTVNARPGFLLRIGHWILGPPLEAAVGTWSSVGPLGLPSRGCPSPRALPFHIS